MSEQTRNIVVTLHRRYSAVGSPRRYARIDTALRKVGERIPHVEPGHVFVLHHAVTGLEIGTVTVKVGGFTAKMIWDRAATN